jgi:hypothetical protein
MIFLFLQADQAMSSGFQRVLSTLIARHAQKSTDAALLRL